MLSSKLGPTSKKNKHNWVCRTYYIMFAERTDQLNYKADTTILSHLNYKLQINLVSTSVFYSLLTWLVKHC